MKKKILALLLMTIIVLGFAACSEDPEEILNSNTENSSKVNNALIEENKDVYFVVNKFIELYNEKALYPIEDIVDMDIHGTDYRTEFRLEAFDNAIGKKGNINDATIDIVNYGHFSNNSIRVYITNSTEDMILDSYKTIVHIFDNTITDEEMMDEFDAASIYLGKTGDITGYAHKTELFLDCDELNFIDIK